MYESMCKIYILYIRMYIYVAMYVYVFILSLATKVQVVGLQKELSRIMMLAYPFCVTLHI